MNPNIQDGCAIAVESAFPEPAPTVKVIYPPLTPVYQLTVSHSDMMRLATLLDQDAAAASTPLFIAVCNAL